MKLEFDSITELEQFLMFSAHIGKAFTAAPAAAPAADLTLSDPRVPAYDWPEGSAPVPMTDVPEVPQAPAAPKRKRRTQAEMIHDAAAKEALPTLLAPLQPQAEQSAPAESAPTPAGGNPFAVAPTMQAVLDAPNRSAATLASMAVMQNAETAPAVVDVKERALQILADPAAIESIAHLRACQGFIQKHGMPKYNESFKEGLNANIAVYTPEQRALHIAILESLDA